MKAKICRYLEPDGHCSYWGEQLLGAEDIRCTEGGWDCYEEAGLGAIYENGKWMTLIEFMGWSGEKIPDNMEEYIPSGINPKDIVGIKNREHRCPCGKIISFPPMSWPKKFSCPGCGAIYERSDS